MASTLPFITIILPVYNEARFIARTLGQVGSQDYPKDRYEVLVVDGMSSDDTVKIALSMQHEFENFRVIENHKRRSSSARNLGFKEGRGDYYLIIDGHVYITGKDLLKDVAEIFTEKDYHVLARPQPLTPPDNSFFQNAVAYARESVIGHGTDSTIYNMEYEGEVNPSSAGAMYSREVIEKVGYVDENFDAAEDYEHNYRIGQAGFMAYFSPRLAVYYYPRESLGSLFAQMARYGLGRFRMWRKHKALSSGVLTPPVFFLTILVTAFLSLLMSEVWIIPVLMLGGYLAVITAGSVFVSLKRGFRYLLLFPFIYLMIHLGLAWGFVSGIFKRNRTTEVSI